MDSNALEGGGHLVMDSSTGEAEEPCDDLNDDPCLGSLKCAQRFDLGPANLSETVETGGCVASDKDTSRKFSSDKTSSEADFADEKEVKLPVEGFDSGLRELAVDKTSADVFTEHKEDANVASSLLKPSIVHQDTPPTTANDLELFWPETGTNKRGSKCWDNKVSDFEDAVTVNTIQTLQSSEGFQGNLTVLKTCTSLGTNLQSVDGVLSHPVEFSSDRIASAPTLLVSAHVDNQNQESDKSERPDGIQQVLPSAEHVYSDVAKLSGKTTPVKCVEQELPSIVDNQLARVVAKKKFSTAMTDVQPQLDELQSFRECETVMGTEKHKHKGIMGATPYWASPSLNERTPERPKRQCKKSWKLRVVLNENHRKLLCQPKKEVLKLKRRGGKVKFTPSSRRWMKRPLRRRLKDFVQSCQEEGKALKSDSTPLQFFMEFFDLSIFRYILDMCNKNAREWIKGYTANEYEWTVTLEELMTYIGLRIVLNMMKFPTTGSYWQKQDPILDFMAPSEVMTRDRYDFISQNLAFCERRQRAPASHTIERELNDNQPLLDHFLPCFKSSHLLGQNLSVTEAQISFKSKDGIHLSGENIGAFLLADLSTGYVSGIEFFNATTTAEKTLSVSAETAMKKLVSPYANSWRTLYIRSSHTSVDLLDHFLKIGVYACGVLHQSREEFPRDLVIEKAAKKAWGFADWRASGPLFVQSWVDHIPVYFMSTHHPQQYSKDRKHVQQYCSNRKLNVLSRRGKLVSKETGDLCCPSLLGNYSIEMGCLTSGNKTRKYRSIFSLLLEVTVTNSEVLFEKARNLNVGVLDFRITLGRMLITMARRRSVSLSCATPADRLSEGKHFPVEIQASQDCALCSLLAPVPMQNPVQSQNSPRSCRKSKIKCGLCGVPICVKPGSTCWEDWHTKDLFM